MAGPKLKVKKRNIFGRKVKKLRAEGILPANIYGKKIKSQAIQLELKKFMPVFREVGETGLVDLLVESEKSARPVLVHNVQFHPVSDRPIHADFHQVSLTEKVKAEIPLELVGEAPAVEQKIGILIQTLNEIEVEALPTELPEKFEADISVLEKIDDMVKVGDLKVDKKVTLLTESSRLIAKIEPPTKIEEEKPPVEEEAPEEEVPAEEAPPEPAEGARPEPAEGARPEPAEGKPAKKASKKEKAADKSKEKPTQKPRKVPKKPS
jgi:large subunit ribosomal protein L25